MDSSSEDLNTNTAPATTTDACMNSATVDSNHPLYLHASDTTNASLISIQLTGCDNYTFWSNAMYIFLVNNNKIGFTDVSYKKESFDPSMHTFWDRGYVVVFAWIMNFVTRELMNIIFYSKSVFLGWFYFRESSTRLMVLGAFNSIQRFLLFNKGLTLLLCTLLDSGRCGKSFLL